MNPSMTTTTLCKISVGAHAIENAISRFNVPRESAAQWIKDHALKSTFVANIVGEDNRPGRLFAYQRITFILADTSDFVMTLFPTSSVNVCLHEKIRKIVQRELLAAERVERAAVHKANVQRAALDIEIAKCNYRMYVTPSKSVIAHNVRQLERIGDAVARIEATLLDVKRTKTRLARSAAAYV